MSFYPAALGCFNSWSVDHSWLVALEELKTIIFVVVKTGHLVCRQGLVCGCKRQKNRTASRSVSSSVTLHQMRQA